MAHIHGHIHGLHDRPRQDTKKWRTITDHTRGLDSEGHYEVAHIHGPHERPRQSEKDTTKWRTVTGHTKVLTL